MCSILYPNFGSASEKIFLQSNSRYIALVDGEREIIIYDTHNNLSSRVSINYNIGHLEICPTHPFLSFAGYDTKNDVLKPKNYYIYDIEKEKLYDGNYFLDDQEYRWSPSGDFSYFNMQTDLLLIHTVDLRNWIESDLNGKEVHKISGHPLGFIWQIAWIGDNLLYGSGISEMECWGLYDTAKKINKFISCCEETHGETCEAKDRNDIEIIKVYLSKQKNNNLKTISNDFFKETQRILKGK